MQPNGADMSRWGGPLTPEECDALWDEGVRTIIFATGPGGYSAELLNQLPNAVKKGFICEVYYFLEWGKDPVWWIQSGVDALGAYKKYITRVWIDVEDMNNTPPATKAEREAYVQSACDTADRLYGFRVGIYSARGYWHNLWSDPNQGMFGSTKFSDRQLWNANYDGDPDIDGLPFGGWTSADVAIEQYQGTTIVGGQSIDLNWVYKPSGVVVAPAPTNPLAELNDAVVKRFQIIELASGDYSKMLAGWQALKDKGLIK